MLVVIVPGAGTKYPIAVKNSGSLGNCTNRDSLSFINISPLYRELNGEEGRGKGV